MIFNAFFVFMLTCCQASNIELPISMDPNGGYWINATIESNGAVFPIRAKLRYFPNALFPTTDDGTVLRIEGDTSSVRIDLSRGGESASCYSWGGTGRVVIESNWICCDSPRCFRIQIGP